MPNVSKRALRRFATRGLSITLSATTALWLTGSSLIFTIPVAHAETATATALVTAGDRVAADGQSGKAILGLNLQTDAGLGYPVRLDSLTVYLRSTDANDRATLANVRRVQLVKDSNGNDLYDTTGDAVVTGADADRGPVSGAPTDQDGDADIVDATLFAQTAAAAVFANSFGHGIAAPTTTICTDNALAAGIAVGDAIAFLDASAATTFNRIVTVVTPITNAAAAATACVAAAGGVTTHTLLTVDTVMAGVAEAAADSTDTITKLGNYPAGITSLVTAADEVDTDFDDEDFMKVGQGATAEIVTFEALVDQGATDRLLIDAAPNAGGDVNTGTNFAHANGDAVQEVEDECFMDAERDSCDSTAPGTPFSTYGDANVTNLHAGFDLGVTLGDPDDVTDAFNEVISSSSHSGYDYFVVVFMEDAANDMSFSARIDATGTIRFHHDIDSNGADAGDTVNVVSMTQVTTNALLTGPDGSAAQTADVWYEDPNNNGKINRVCIRFGESMATSAVAVNDDFDSITNISQGGTIYHDGDASGNDADAFGAENLDSATDEWTTTTVADDTFCVNLLNEWAGAANFDTGRSFTFTYDNTNGSDGAALDAADLRFQDKSGQNAGSFSQTMTDKARPTLVSATRRDNSGNSRYDEIRIVASEPYKTTGSTSAGVKLVDTTPNPDVTLTLGAITSFTQTNQANDTAIIAVTEQGAADVTDAFTLSYTTQTSDGLQDPASNQAFADTDILPFADASLPVIAERGIELYDLCNGDQTALVRAVECGTIAAPRPDGQIDTARITFAGGKLVDIPNGDLDEDAISTANHGWAVSGYVLQNIADAVDEAGADLAAAGDDVINNTNTLFLWFAQSGQPDTHLVPQVTYTEPAEVDNRTVDGADNAIELENVSAATTAEVDLAGPVLIANRLYEKASSNDSIWNNGESLVVEFSEAVAQGTVNDTNWATTLAPDGVLVDWTSGGEILANEFPDSGTITYTTGGRFVTLTATASATDALDAADSLTPVANELKDAVGRPAVVGDNDNDDDVDGADDAITLEPAAAAVAEVRTVDSDMNGLLNGVDIHFTAPIDDATITASEWAAAKTSNFTIGAGEAATASTQVSPDLCGGTMAACTVQTGVVANDNILELRWTEVFVENTGGHPQVKYVATTTLKDLAGNNIASFNQYGADTSKFLSGALVNDSLDRAQPVVLLKYLRDRNMNGMYDQLVAVLSEGVRSTTDADANPLTLENGLQLSTGFTVEGHTLALNGVLSNNTDFSSLTSALVNVVYSVDVNETTVTEVPGVTYTTSGVHIDTFGNNSLLDGGVVQSEITFAPPQPEPEVCDDMIDNDLDGAVDMDDSDCAEEPEPEPMITPHNDGDLIRASNGTAVYVSRHVGAQLFKRHVLSAAFDTFYPHLAPFWSHVVVVTPETIAAHTLSAWVRLVMTSDPETWKIYEVNDDGSKHWITCADANNCAATWLAAGGDPNGVYTVNAAEMNSYTTGPNVFLQ